MTVGGRFVLDRSDLIMIESGGAGGWLEACLAGIPHTRMTVFGDFCLDAYWLIDPDESELSVETGLPVRRVRQQRYSLGGAGNVVANLVDLGVGKVQAVSLVGQDLFGGQMLRTLEQLKVDVGGMLVSGTWQTLVYSKPCIGTAEQNRMDFGAFNALSAAEADFLAGALDRAASASDVVILNQQVPSGASTPEMIERINAVVAARPACRFLVDSRHRAELYRGCMLKVNAHEASRLCGRPRPLDERISAEDARNLAGELHTGTGKTVFVTRGDSGLIVADGGHIEEVPGIQVLEQTDPVGAGDTVTSAIAAVLAAGGSAVAAGRLANIAASVTVRKLQTTGTASPAEIRQIGPSPDYIYLPELADDPRGARRLPDSEIEIVRDLPCFAKATQGEAPAKPCEALAKQGIGHAIFDHDGTISTLRQGWEQIMEPMMVRAILGRHYQDADEALYHKVVDTVRQFVERTTGAQTLVQMQGLVDLVRHFGCVADADVLDMHGYKKLYNDELLAMVRRRVDKLRRGELAPADFQMKGALTVLQALHARGVKLYLASGTDQADVAAEAETLGYAGLFEGRIFGAVGDLRVEAKRVVLERIFQEHGFSGSAVVTFGDGPVEMRETRKRDGIAVGVASDEVRRFGLNPTKRSRLIRAGADLIVPDFSQHGRLMEALFPEY
jgi:rfaE bifunctional protein kinase chain/domain